MARNYRLRIDEKTTRVYRDGGYENASLVEVIAEAGEGQDLIRFSYIGSVPCRNRQEAADLIARIVDWEFHTGKSIDPPAKPGAWLPETQKARELAIAASLTWNPTPSIWSHRNPGRPPGRPEPKPIRQRIHSTKIADPK